LPETRGLQLEDGVSRSGRGLLKGRTAMQHPPVAMNHHMAGAQPVRVLAPAHGSCSAPRPLSPVPAWCCSGPAGNLRLTQRHRMGAGMPREQVPGRSGSATPVPMAQGMQSFPGQPFFQAPGQGSSGPMQVCRRDWPPTRTDGRLASLPPSCRAAFFGRGGARALRACCVCSADTRRRPRTARSTAHQRKARAMAGSFRS